MKEYVNLHDEAFFRLVCERVRQDCSRDSSNARPAVWIEDADNDRTLWLHISGDTEVTASVSEPKGPLLNGKIVEAVADYNEKMKTLRELDVG